MTENLTVPERTARVEVSDLQIRNLGRCLHPSPLAARLGREVFHPVGGADRVLLDARFSRVAGTLPAEQPTFELAGPRDKTFFDPSKSRAGFVPCGGLCPGINTVLRGIELELPHAYGVKHIIGFRYGYEG